MGALPPLEAPRPTSSTMPSSNSSADDVADRGPGEVRLARDVRTADGAELVEGAQDEPDVVLARALVRRLGGQRQPWSSSIPWRPHRVSPVLLRTAARLRQVVGQRSCKRLKRLSSVLTKMPSRNPVATPGHAVGRAGRSRARVARRPSAATWLDTLRPWITCRPRPPAGLVLPGEPGDATSVAADGRAPPPRFAAPRGARGGAPAARGRRHPVPARRRHAGCSAGRTTRASRTPPTGAGCAS